MSFKSKYIILETGLIPMGLPIVFSDLLTHADVARGIEYSGKVHGAGFCYVVNDRYVCYGESVSLNVKSRGEEDSKILNKLLGVDSESSY